MVIGTVSIVVVTLTPAIAWSQPLSAQFDGGAGFGAITSVAGVVGGCGTVPQYGSGPTMGKAPRLTGGEGIPAAQDSYGSRLTNGDVVATEAKAVPIGASAVLRGFVRANASVGCGSNSFPVDAAGNILALSYNTYTVTSATLPPGTPLGVSLDWTFTGTFSTLTTASQIGNGQAFFNVGLVPFAYASQFRSACGLGAGSLLVSQVVDSQQTTNVWMSNTIDLSTAWLNMTNHALRVGDSFILASCLRVDGQGQTGQGSAMTSDFSAETIVYLTGTNGTPIASIQANRPLAWGRNSDGQLGDGTTTDRSTPVPVSSLSNLGAVAAGYLGSIGVDPLGDVWAWGTDVNGPSLTPVRVPDPSDSLGFLRNVHGVALGAGHNLAVKRDGTVWAWGNNSNGQLGDGTTTDRLHPVQVKDPSDPTGFLTDVRAVAASNQSSFSLALKHDDTVWAWGRNNAGQLGNKSTTDSLTPVQVQKSTGGSLTDVTMIAAGSESGLALTRGWVWAWGRNSDGALGDGTFTEKHSAVQVVGPGATTGFLQLVAAIAGGGAFSLALAFDGTAFAWGENFFGQLGNGTLSGSNTPVQIMDPTDSSGKFTGGASIGGGFAGGIAHSLARKSDGTVRAWGHNPFGELGDGTTTDSSTPVVVKNLDHVGPLSAGAFYGLALAAINTRASAGPVTAIGTSPATITFSSVSQSGTTKVTTSASGPPPPQGFSLDGGNGNPPTYYDITTTVTFAGSITVCLDYTGTSFAGTTTQPVFQHFDKTLNPPQWVNVTVTYWNQTENIVCGTVNSLSPFALMKVVDYTPPMVTCSVMPNMLWPPDHEMVPVTARVTVADDFSGPAGFTLTSVASSEPDSDRGKDDRPDDIQEFAVGTASTKGLLRAERSETGRGRIYTLTYTGLDVAGNSATCAATVVVPLEVGR
jgi:alpha-tubulin suppressor-like RCC1 family protein